MLSIKRHCRCRHIVWQSRSRSATKVGKFLYETLAKLGKLVDKKATNMRKWAKNTKLKENFCFRLSNQEGLWKKTSPGKSKKQAHPERSIYHEDRCWKPHTALIPRCRFSTILTFMKSECVLQLTALELLGAKQHSWYLVLSVHAWTS